MIEFPQPPKEYSSVYLAETDKPLPEKLNPNTRYAFFSTIATGGKSLIKSCKDLHLSRFVCYKTLKPEFSDNAVEQQRLIREARVTAMLQHPSTVPTYELGRDKKGNPYFTMKLVHGYTLREILNYRERYDLFQLIEVIIQLTQGLEYAHAHGVAHRDIKPENVLVGPFGEVVLLDWGLAKVWNLAAESTQPVRTEGEASGFPVDEEIVATLAEKAKEEVDLTITSHEKPQGTITYMSPEQLRNDPTIGYQTDIYSVGAVLYELLCGETPSKGEKLHEVAASVLEDEPVLPSEISKVKIPKILENAAMRCLQKKPEQRFGKIGELTRELQLDWRSELLWTPGNR